jgi:inorganic triphosphatase YgiF
VLREAVEAHVDDAARRQAALAEVDRLTRELRSFGGSVEAWRNEMARLMTDYRTTRHDIEQLVGVANTSRERFRARLIESRLALAKTLTAAEWQAVADADATLVAQWAAADAAPQ